MPTKRPGRRRRATTPRRRPTPATAGAPPSLQDAWSDTFQGASQLRTVKVLEVLGGVLHHRATQPGADDDHRLVAYARAVKALWVIERARDTRADEALQSLDKVAFEYLQSRREDEGELPQDEIAVPRGPDGTRKGGEVRVRRSMSRDAWSVVELPPTRYRGRQRVVNELLETAAFIVGDAFKLSPSGELASTKESREQRWAVVLAVASEVRRLFPTLPKLATPVETIGELLAPVLTTVEAHLLRSARNAAPVPEKLVLELLQAFGLPQMTAHNWLGRS